MAEETAEGGEIMAEKTRAIARLARGFWDTPEGRILLNKVRRKEMNTQELAAQLHITDSAVYNALSKRNLTQAPVPIASDPALDRLLASVEGFLGEVVTTRLHALQRHLAESMVRAETAERELEVYRNKYTDQEAMVQSLQRRISERVARMTEGSPND